MCVFESMWRSCREIGSFAAKIVCWTTCKDLSRVEKYCFLQAKVYVWPHVKTSLRSRGKILFFAAKSVNFTPYEDLATLAQKNTAFCREKCRFDPIWRPGFAHTEKYCSWKPKVYVWPHMRTSLRSRGEILFFAAKSVGLTSCEDLASIVRRNTAFCSKKCRFDPMWESGFARAEK